MVSPLSWLWVSTSLTGGDSGPRGVLAIITVTSVHGGEPSEHPGISPGLVLLDYPKERHLTPQNPVLLAAWTVAHGLMAM